MSSMSDPGTVIAVALTRQQPRAGFPLVWDSTATGLPKRSGIKISPLRIRAGEQLGTRLARASAEEVSRVVERLSEIIGD
jgi:mRNA interferase MazF